MKTPPKTPPLPKDSRGRVLWERVPGFQAWITETAPGLTNSDLKEAISKRYGCTIKVEAVSSIRRRSLAYMTDETRRKAYEQRTDRHRIAEATIPNFVRELGVKDASYFVEVDGDCFVTSDWHIPHHDETLVTRLLQLAKRFKVKQLVINGDFLNQDAFSRWRAHRFNVPWPVEKDVARNVIRQLYQGFDRIFYILDNHDRRLIVANETRAGGGLDESDVVDLLTYGVGSGKLRASVDYHYTLINRTWRVTSPKEYRRVKLSLPNRLAQLYHQNVIVGGDHLFGVGLDDSGRYVIANDMCMVEQQSVPYVMVQDTTYPHWNSGFYGIFNNILYPFCTHSSLTDWTYWLERAIPPVSRLAKSSDSIH